MKNFKELFVRSLRLISSKDKQRILRSIPTLFTLSLLDLLGVILLGTVATLTFNNVTANSSPTRLEVVLGEILPNNLKGNSLIIFLSLVSFFSLLAKTLLQAIYQLRLGRFLAQIEVKISQKLFRNILTSPIPKISRFTLPEIHYSLTAGTNLIVQGIIGNTVILISDTLTAILMLSFAVYASPLTTASVVLVFFITYFLFNTNINARARDLGSVTQASQIELNDVISESINGVREIQAYAIGNRYSTKFVKSKTTTSFVGQQKIWLLGSVKYLLEAAILVSGILAATVLLLTSDIKRAVTVTAIFILIGFRLLPIVQRIQNSITSLRIAKTSTSFVFQLLSTFTAPEMGDELVVGNNSRGKLTKIKCNEISFEYRENDLILREITFDIIANQTTIILGESGVGKSTLIDILTGSTLPKSGSVEYYIDSETTPLPPGGFPLSYISQNCALFGEDIYENITLTEDLTSQQSAKVNEIIEELNLNNLFVNSVSQSRIIRKDSTNVSGGERQRISLARAIYFDSDLLIFDEPTSSLDPENKQIVRSYLSTISHRKTVVIVTHDREMLNIADRVVEIKDKEVCFIGSRAEYLGK